MLGRWWRRDLGWAGRLAISPVGRRWTAAAGRLVVSLGGWSDQLSHPRHGIVLN